eukprot:TRINITY_DN15126_c0_g1_i1.p1 TRINITY_DN15126_c0_g1~~TRINITY_DN15126_c0_g1_i1.p1  ORF type:complete len:197 (+),score=50.47 TRINITY_DN15126_c0_g1_i1:86-676(+)
MSSKIVFFLLFIGYVCCSMNYISNRIYVGDQYAAGNVSLLTANNITAVLNVAWDLDIRYDAKYYVGDMSDDNEHLQFQYNKVGLVDGTGNKESMLIAGMEAVDQFASTRILQSKDQPTYPQPVQNILVHCHSGHSRSVTITSLYLSFYFPEQYPSYESALAFVKAQRGIQNDHNVPVPALTLQAENIYKKYNNSLF